LAFKQCKLGLEEGEMPPELSVKGSKIFNLSTLVARKGNYGWSRKAVGG